MGLSEQIRQQLINSFKSEQSEHVQKINQGLLALEKNPASAEERQALLKEIFREAHSLKGAARAVGMNLIESLGHALEEVLLRAKDGHLDFSAELFDLLYQALDAIEVVLTRLEAGDSAPPAAVLTLLGRLEAMAQPRQAPPPDEPPAPPDIEPTPPPDTEPATPPPTGPESQPVLTGTGDETIRVSVSKLDALMGQFSELLGAKIRAEQRLAEVRQLQVFAGNWHKEWQSLRSSYSRLIRNQHSARATHQRSPGSGDGQNRDLNLLMHFMAQNQEQLRAFNAQTSTLYRQLSNDTMRLSLIMDELQEEIKRVRMLPLSTITATFGRMVRDLAREQNKQIKLTVTGGETELDKRVLEQIKDPLMHLLRNAVDHGLEATETRQLLGKAPTGHISLTASQQGNNVVITVSDDGAGLDLNAIRLAAVRKGLLTSDEADKLSDAETTPFIFNSGLSTSRIITDISGRGVGLDVVRQNVEELHGTLEVNSTPGQGTAFTLTLPLTLASSRGLLVRSGEQIFALPLTTVERMLHLQRNVIASVEGKEAITYQNQPIALARLEDLLELPPNLKEMEQVTVVVIAVAEKRLGLIVDDLAGEQEIVIKSLGKQLSKIGGIAGATVLGSGQVILVLHAADLVKLAARTQTRTPLVGESKAQETTQQKTILVVDDSITTRTLEKNILEAAGYQVKLATDGEEALGVLVSGNLPHLVVSDINMPRLDGFDLTQRLKHDNRYTGIPVILVTSLDSPADKARGIEVGADAYIVKSRFDQGTLLETIEQLI